MVGSYVRQGCYTEGNGVRALSGAQYVDYVGMTLEICAANCAGTAYFGVEYGGECKIAAVIFPFDDIANILQATAVKHSMSRPSQLLINSTAVSSAQAMRANIAEQAID